MKKGLPLLSKAESGLYVCLRPVRWYQGIHSPVRHPEKVNMCVFRENTEDIYAGIEWEAGTPEAEKFYKFLHDEMAPVTVLFWSPPLFPLLPRADESPGGGESVRPPFRERLPRAP